MATEKRDRQRANRAEKQAAEAKRQRRLHTFDLVKKWALWGVLIVAAVLIANFFLG